MRKNEVDFSNTLNSVQKEQFEKILDNRLQALSLSSKDEYICGYQLGAKMMIGVYTSLS